MFNFVIRVALRLPTLDPGLLALDPRLPALNSRPLPSTPCPYPRLPALESWPSTPCPWIMALDSLPLIPALDSQPLTPSPWLPVLDSQPSTPSPQLPALDSQPLIPPLNLNLSIFWVKTVIWSTFRWTFKKLGSLWSHDLSLVTFNI
jgi:hypothetical protein